MEIPSPSRASASLALQALLEPLSGYCDPRTLARLGSTCRSLRETLRDPGSSSIWAAAAAHLGISVREERCGTPCRDVLSAWLARREAFHPDTARGAIISPCNRASLRLAPGPLRVAAVSSFVPVGPAGRIGVEFRARELTRTHGVILWLGVVYDAQGGGRELDATTVDDALRGYEVSREVGRGRARGTARECVAERFGTMGWGMSALGSNGSVWSQGRVGDMRGSGYRFGGADPDGDAYAPPSRVLMQVDLRRNELSFQVGSSPWIVAVKRLLPRGRQPKVYAVAHLTDIAAPVPARRAVATVELDEVWRW